MLKRSVWINFFGQNMLMLNQPNVVAACRFQPKNWSIEKTLLKILFYCAQGKELLDYNTTLRLRLWKKIAHTAKNPPSNSSRHPRGIFV